MKKFNPNAVTELRKCHGLTMEGYGARLNSPMDRRYVWRLEHGKMLPSVKVLAQMAEAYEVSVDYFFTDSNPTTISKAVGNG